MNEELDNFLAHYGVKGMKWGVRKAQRASGRPSFNKENADVLTTAKLKLGGKLLERDQLKYERSALQSIHKELKADPDPKDIENPANVGDYYVGSGFTFNGSNYTKFANDTSFYYKFDTGEKSFTMFTADASPLWMHMDSKGTLIPEEKLKARDPNFTHSMTHGAAGELIARHGSTLMTEIEEVKDGTR